MMKHYGFEDVNLSQSFSRKFINKYKIAKLPDKQSEHGYFYKRKSLIEIPKKWREFGKAKTLNPELTYEDWNKNRKITNIRINKMRQPDEVTITKYFRFLQTVYARRNQKGYDLEKWVAEARINRRVPSIMKNMGMIDDKEKRWVVDAPTPEMAKQIIYENREYAEESKKRSQKKNKRKKNEKESISETPPLFNKNKSKPETDYKYLAALYKYKDVFATPNKIDMKAFRRELSIADSFEKALKELNILIKYPDNKYQWDSKQEPSMELVAELKKQMELRNLKHDRTIVAIFPEILNANISIDNKMDILIERIAENNFVLDQFLGKLEEFMNYLKG